MIVLDEPTHGLDPLQVVAFRDFIKSLSENRAILFSSHIVSEVHEISERILVIHHGRLLANQSVARLESDGAERGQTFEERVLSIFRGDAEWTEALGSGQVDPSTGKGPGKGTRQEAGPALGGRDSRDRGAL